MIKPQEEGLSFTLTVDEMLQLNTVMISNFTVDKAVFIAKVPDLTDPFLEDWKLNTTQLSTIESDSDFLDTQLLMTQAVDELMFIARDQLQTIYFYLERSFTGDKAIQSYFGKDRYEASRNSPQKLINLLLKANEASEKADYKDELITKGLKQTVIDDLDTTAAKLKTKVDEREIYMSSRKLATQHRKKLLNKIWDSMADVNEASKLVYKTDYAKQQQYLLYYPKTKTNDNTTKPTIVA
ncbi:MAG: hypothetical protein ACOYO1_13715 [Bacteroidales bacterium]